MAEAECVLLFGTEFPPSAAGTAVYARALALGLAGQGARVHVLTQAPAGGEAAGDDDLPFAVTRIPWTANAVRRYARCAGALAGHLQALRPTVLWTTNGMGTRVAGLFGRLPCPLVSCARGSDIRTRLPGRGPWRRLESVPQRRAYRRSAAIAAACRDLKRLAVERGLDGSRIFVSHSAFDFDRLAQLAAALAGVAPEPLAVLTVARLTAQKRVDVVLRAVARVARQVPGVRYAVVGDGPERGRLEALAAQLSIADRVRFTGPLRPFSAQLCAEYRRAAVFAMTSVGEGLANVFIEAGAFGLPSLGCDDGGTPEIVRQGETGWLVRPDDPEAAAQRLAQLLASADERRRLGAAARAWVEAEFGLQTLGARSLAVVRAVAAGRPPPRELVEA